MPLNFMRVVALSAVLAGTIASAQVLQTSKLPPAAYTGTANQNFPQPQVDVAALANKVAALENKVSALESKLAAMQVNIDKLLTHTHDVNTSLDFSSTVVSDIHSIQRTVVIPIGNFGHPSGVSGQPKFK
jgi:peptidoglycan hydrolase CwlO-like protein